MADGVKIEIVSPERLVVSQQVQSVTVPGSEGYFTVLGEHAPLMSVGVQRATSVDRMLTAP